MAVIWIKLYSGIFVAKIQAVLFDIGETLLNFGNVDAVELFRQGTHLAYDFLKKSGRPVDNFRIYMAKHLIMIRLNILFAALKRRDFDSFELLKKMGTKKGIRFELQQWLEYAGCWYEPLRKIANIEPDIIQTLKKLKDAGLKLGVLSNTFINAATLEEHLEKLGLLEFFDARLYSYEYPFRKPDTRIFGAAAEKLDIEPTNVLFVGDRINIDIKGAADSGMLGVLKRAYTNIHKKIPDNIAIIDKLSELPELIESINIGQKEMVR